MDFAHGVRPGQAQEVVVAPEVPRVVREPLAPEVLLREAVALEHRAHGAVQHEDALPEDRGEALEARLPAERRDGAAGAGHRGGNVPRGCPRRPGQPCVAPTTSCALAADLPHAAPGRRVQPGGRSTAATGHRHAARPLHASPSGCAIRRAFRHVRRVFDGERGTRSGLSGEMTGEGAPGTKGLKTGALGFVSNVVIGVASTAPAYSLAVSLGLVAAAVGLASPAIMWVAFIPMLCIAIAYYYMNRADPDCGTSFTWVTTRDGPAPRLDDRLGDHRRRHHRHRQPRRGRGAVHVQPVRRSTSIENPVIAGRDRRRRRSTSASSPSGSCSSPR